MMPMAGLVSEGQHDDRERPNGDHEDPPECIGLGPQRIVHALVLPAGAVAHARLEDVDGGVDDQPHDVDEVPVDARDLHPEVILGGGPEVAAEGSDGREADSTRPTKT